MSRDLLSECYDKLLSFLPGKLESLRAAQCVERHRLDWRPERVHTVLLAESHVFTPDSELLPMRGHPDWSEQSLNTTFCRFVYCLGYGEPDFCGPALSPRGGTPQYWKLFASCVQPASAAAFAPILKGSNPDFTSRLRAKIDLLQQLKKLGVWLVDASAIALYVSGGSRVHGAAYKRVLKSCWDTYTWHLVREVSPHSLVVIGKGVARALETELKSLVGMQVECVAQPQGCRRPGDIDRMYGTLYRVCQHAARARGAI